MINDETRISKIYSEKENISLLWSEIKLLKAEIEKLDARLSNQNNRLEFLEIHLREDILCSLTNWSKEIDKLVEGTGTINDKKMTDYV